MIGNDLALLAVSAAVIISAPFAIRATFRLWRLWRGDLNRSLLLLAFWVVALIVTVAGVWIGFLSVRRILGYEPLGWSAPITAVVTVFVLQVPMLLDALVGRVSRRPDEPDNIGGSQR